MILNSPMIRTADGRQVPDPWTTDPETVDEAIGLAFMLFTDIHMGLFQPTDTSAVTWKHALEGIEPRAIVKAAREHVRSGGRDTPKPDDIRKRARPPGGTTGPRPISQREADDARAIECRDTVLRLKARGQWERTDAAHRHYLETWAALAPAQIEADPYRSSADVASLAKRLADKLDAAPIYRRDAPKRIAGCSALPTVAMLLVVAYGYVTGTYLARFDSVRDARSDVIAALRSDRSVTVATLATPHADAAIAKLIRGMR